MSNKLKLAAPWTTFFRQIQAFFKADESVKVVYDEENTTIKLYVEDARKAAALEEILPSTKEFGNIILKIDIIPGNTQSEDKGSVLKNAFYGNKAVVEIINNESQFYPAFTYVVLQALVVQFYNDDLNDPHGVCSTLYQDVARDIFSVPPNVRFCTATPNRSLGYAFTW